MNFVVLLFKKDMDSLMYLLMYNNIPKCTAHILMVLIWLLTACLACYFFAEKYINPNALFEKDRINIFWPGRAQKNSFQKMFLAFCGLEIQFVHRDIIHY